jgi:hypothetical protein
MSAAEPLSPLIVLGPGRSYTTVATAMLGQHPKMYGFPETHLLMTRTMRGWWALFAGGFLSHGLLRLVAELFIGGQTESTIRLAELWLVSRLSQSSPSVFRELAERVSPRTPIDKSPIIVKNVESLRTVQRAFPNAKYIHLTRHPVSYSLSILRLLEDRLVSAELKGPAAARRVLSSAMFSTKDMIDHNGKYPVIDPLIRWHKEHSNILSFLAEVRPGRQLRVRGEDLVNYPDTCLRQITDWLGLKSDCDTIDRMKHPENWAFANVGPLNAPFGGDPNFNRNPMLHGKKSGQASLDGRLSWKADKIGVNHEVRRMAERFGYS